MCTCARLCLRLCFSPSLSLSLYACVLLCISCVYLSCSRAFKDGLRNSDSTWLEPTEHSQLAQFHRQLAQFHRNHVKNNDAETYPSKERQPLRSKRRFSVRTELIVLLSRHSAVRAPARTFHTKMPSTPSVPVQGSALSLRLVKQGQHKSNDKESPKRPGENRFIRRYQAGTRIIRVTKRKGKRPVETAMCRLAGLAHKAEAC